MFGFFVRGNTVDRIIGRFNKAVDDLRAEAQRQECRGARASVRICELSAEREAAYAESIRADRIADKIEELVS